MRCWLGVFFFFFLKAVVDKWLGSKQQSLVDFFPPFSWFTLRTVTFCVVFFFLEEEGGHQKDSFRNPRPPSPPPTLK